MNKTILALIFLALTGIVTAECVEQDNRVTKNGVSFPNYCQDENNLVKNYCSNDSIEQEYLNCNCVIQNGYANDVCIEGTNDTCTGDTCSVNETNKTKYCNSEWICDDWNTCTEGKQTRICTDVNICTEEKTKTEEQDCTPVTPPVTPPSSAWLWITIIVIIAVIVVGYFLMRKPQNKKLNTT